MSLDWDKLRIQSLLICERILGTSNKDMIWRLIYRGASYADSLQFQRCIDLWKYALELRVRRDSILWCDTCFLGQTLARYDHQHTIILNKIKLIQVLSKGKNYATTASFAFEQLKLCPLMTTTK